MNDKTASSREIDAQAKAILQGLKTLGELLEIPMAREALDVSKNAKTSTHYEVLRRLRQSLQQYLERNGDLFYVGLLGHFSSGKSSTINSLLDIWKTKDERATDLHPTDTTITLITQEKNSSSLLGIVREGHVTIRLQAIEHPLLESLVVVDTPGTGDPSLIEEIARDFLPICDVILFLFPATSPLDQTDIPLLVELHKRLPFIPLRFVITRADELRIDSSKPLSDSNIDPTRTSKFLAEAVSRINSLLKPTVYTEEQFTVIDNKSKYCIESLRAFLLSKCDASNQGARVTMHLNKLHFYLSGAKELRGFFGDFLNTKLGEITKIVTAAGRNIQRYNEIVSMSNSNLTRAWAGQHASVNDARYKTLQRLKAVPDLPNDANGFSKVVIKRNQVSSELSKEAQYVAGRISARARLDLLKEFRHRLSETEASILSADLDDLRPGKHALTTVSVKSNLSDIESIPSELLGIKYTDIRIVLSNVLQDCATDLKGMIEETDRLLQARAPLTQCEEVIHAAQTSLTNDLGQFFQNVELYRNGVFSHTTKESIATLGIGGKLDALESEFTEDDRTSFAAGAGRELFPGFAELSATAITKITIISEKLRSLVESIKNLKIERPPSIARAIEIAAKEQAQIFQAEIERELQAESDRLSEKLAISIDHVILNTQTAFRGEMAAAVKQRRRHYSTIVGGTAFIATGAYLAYHYFRAPAPGSMVGAIGWGIVANLIADVLSFLWARTRDQFPKTVQHIRDGYNTSLRANLRALIESELEARQFSALSETALTGRLVLIYQRILSIDLDDFAARAAQFLQALRKSYGEYTALRVRYFELINEITQQCAQYFSDSFKNLEVLNAVASQIKARAIEPSFTLLEQTRQQLENVKKDIEAVEFS